MATVNLGRIKPVFRGAYNNSTAYVVDDIVTQSDETFICILASTGNATSNATYWTKLAAKGTDGTDVGTTLTTQGDILYRDGSGLQRLAKPASNKYLQNTSGGVLSWESVSSDMVKLAEVTAAGTESQISVDGYFSSTYKVYKAYIRNIGFNGDVTGYFLMRVNVGGSAHSSGYYSSDDGAYGESGQSVYWKDRRYNGGEFNHGGWNAPTVTTSGLTNSLAFEYTFWNPTSTTFHKNVKAEYGGWERALTYTYGGTGSGVIHTTSALTGFTFKQNGTSTIKAGTVVTLYGIK